MNEGDSFPDFELLTHEEKTVRRSDLQGQAFALFAYPKASTPGCTKEACSIRDHYQELNAMGIKPLGISTDKPAKNKKFAEKYNFQYDLLSDEDGKLLSTLGAYGEKKMYGKTYQGTYRYTFIVGKDGKIKKIFKKVNTAEHGQEILDAVAELDL